jgi:hypothetical protein
MVQMGFFDADRRLEVLSKKGDPLEAIDRPHWTTGDVGAIAGPGSQGRGQGFSWPL